jgi:hypothetical protein
MDRTRRGPSSGALALALSSAALLVTASAASEPSVVFPIEQPAPVSARVALLEQRVHRLEQRLAVFERVGLRARSDGARELTLNDTTVIIEADGRVTITPRTSEPGVSGRMPAAPPDCDPPYSYDSEGIKRFKRSCL